ncbi:transporter associated domain-containing protein [Oceanobacillus sp. J11TS1]|uniref:transporter associated domain-containing protein n=1 Tax=Oceanobacillus sp. J11TS1 TaxID=2807191 RepID=UPI001B16031A|nr:transporter associated domain-containing protein [Oceanobacillus sp. J11TS1]GIO25038.1 hypothetical protein J11TS1_36190 [Oceanobacillus sp. J11TS1]
MAIPIVTFLIFIIGSFTYYALKETTLSTSINEDARLYAVLRFLPYGIIFISLFSSAWLGIAIAMPIAQYLSKFVLPFSQVINQFIAVFSLSILLFGVWLCMGYLLPKWLAKKHPQLIIKGLSLLSLTSVDKDIQDLKSLPKKQQEETPNIIEFSGKDVGEIATHRTDLAVLQMDASLDDVFSMIEEVEFTRIPVYDQDIDQIVGILYVKDFFSLLKSGVSPAFFSLKYLIRNAHFVRMNQEIDDVFKDMKKKDYTIAIVLDEFGGTHGLITLEDIIRDITKDLLGEQKSIAPESKEIVHLTDNRYLIAGSTSLFVLEGTLGVEFPIDTDQTLANFLSELMTHLPEKQHTIKYKHLQFTIQSVKDNQIESVIVTVHDEDIMEHQFIG